MANIPNRLFLVLAAATLGLLLACNKSEFNDLRFADRNAEYAFPLFNTTLQLDDLMYKVLNDTLSNDTLLINDDNTMTLIYTGDVAQKPATDIFKFFEGGFFPLLDTLYTNPIDAPSGVIIYQADMKAGQIGITIFNTNPEIITGYVEIPQMSKGGVVFTYPFTAPAGSSTLASQWVSPAIPVDGYVLESDNNQLQFKYYAYRPNGERIKMDVAGFPGIVVSFSNMEFSYLEGYWGYSRYPFTRDTIEIDINQTDLNGNVKVKNPEITMQIANSWGFPTRGVVKYLSFIGQNGEELKLEADVFINDSFVDFNYPSFAAGELGQTKYTTVLLNESNSNIADIFNSQPVQFIYELDGISNVQQDPNLIGFMTDTSIIRLLMRVELLLEGSAENFSADQTLDLNFGDFSGIDTSLIELAEFKLVTENRTPISVDMQILFQDADGVVIDSLFTGGPKTFIRSTPIDNLGQSIGVERVEEFIPMSAERFSRVRNAKRALLQTSFTTANGGQTPVRLLATDDITVKMGIKLKTRY